MIFMMRETILTQFLLKGRENDVLLTLVAMSVAFPASSDPISAPCVFTQVRLKIIGLATENSLVIITGMLIILKTRTEYSIAATVTLQSNITKG